jgi:hypothetical protein
MNEHELREKVEALEAGLREAGLYFNRTQLIMPPEEGEEEEPDKGIMAQPKPTVPGNSMLIVDCHVGDLAFSPRVQDPDQQDWDRSFREISRGLVSENFEEERQKLMKEFGVEE